MISGPLSAALLKHFDPFWVSPLRYLVSAVMLGGMLAGLVIDGWGARAGFGVAIGAGIMMVVVVLVGLRTLEAASVAHVEPEFSPSP